MIVCPNCRHVNEEERGTCGNCGGSLEPGHHAMLATRRTGAELSPIEIKTPEPPPKWRPWVMLGVLVLALGGFFVWRIVRPDPCRGTDFTSDRFGYCLDVPGGWKADDAMVGNVTVDQFTLPKRSTTVLVEAVDLTQDTNLQGFGDFVRRKDTDAGLSPGPVRDLILDGVDAQQWDITVTSATAAAYQIREVVVVSGHIGWRITLNDTQANFGTDAKSFQRMLDSWRFA